MDDLINLAVVERNGKLVLHRPECAVVSLTRARGDIIITMYGCQPSAVLDEYPQHSCLKQ